MCIPTQTNTLMKRIETLAQAFFDAFYDGRFESDMSHPISDLSIEQAYQIQDAVADKRVARGEPVVGYKVGCTSAAIQRQFGLTEPICGRLYEPYVYDAGVPFFWDDFINCAIEPELVLKINTDLCCEHLDDEILIDAIEFVSPGIEVHLFKFWFSPNTSQELIASNGIHTCLIIGAQKVSPHGLSFRHEMFRVFKDGSRVTQARASEIMGGPLNSLRWLVGFLTRKGTCLHRGSLVIPGSPVELVEIRQNTSLRVEIDDVGSIVTDVYGRNAPGKPA